MSARQRDENLPLAKMLPQEREVRLSHLIFVSMLRYQLSMRLIDLAVHLSQSSAAQGSGVRQGSLCLQHLGPI